MWTSSGRHVHGQNDSLGPDDFGVGSPGRLSVSPLGGLALRRSTGKIPSILPGQAVTLATLALRLMALLLNVGVLHVRRFKETPNAGDVKFTEASHRGAAAGDGSDVNEQV